jgi:hypothetical protein
MSSLIRFLRTRSKNYQLGFYDGYERQQIRTIRFIEDKILLLDSEDEQKWMLENLLQQIKETS